jgi:hypothetical protein
MHSEDKAEANAKGEKVVHARTATCQYIIPWGVIESKPAIVAIQ